MAKITKQEEILCMQLGEDLELFQKKKDLAEKLANQFNITEVQAMQCINCVFLNPDKHNGATWTQKATQEIVSRFKK